MKNPLILHITKQVQLSPEEVELILSVVKKKVLGKKKFLLYEGQTCRYLSYVESGCLRIYSINKRGLEHIVFFAIEDWWAIELKSFIQQTPSRFFIETIHDSTLLQISKTDFDMLLDKIPKLEKWFRILLQNALISSEDRIDNKTALRASDRYNRFIEKYPTLESQISQKYIASYLGISPEFLSTLKAKRWKNQKS